MRRRQLSTTVTITLLVAGAALALPGIGARIARGQAARAVPYPEGFRNWLHLKSMVIHERSHPLFEAFGGIHHVYANPTAAPAARAGTAFPDGSVLVFDLLEAKAEGGAMVEGARKFTAVMVKDARAYAETGGWGFEAFKGDTRDQRVVTDAKTQCFACHQGVRATDYVFTKYRP